MKCASASADKRGEYTAHPRTGVSGKGVHPMHGSARLRLVGITGAQAAETLPQPLPFPVCIRDLPIHSRAASEDALMAMEAVSRKMNDLARALGCTNPSGNDDGGRPSAA